MLITYTDGEEIIICTPETEARTLEIWFEEGGRNLEEYDRDCHFDEAIAISNKLTIG